MYLLVYEAFRTLPLLIIIDFNPPPLLSSPSLPSSPSPGASMLRAGEKGFVASVARFVPEARNLFVIQPESLLDPKSRCRKYLPKSQCHVQG